MATENFARMLERLGLVLESQTYRPCVADETDQAFQSCMLNDINHASTLKS
jgi:hypothetical protein